MVPPCYLPRWLSAPWPWNEKSSSHKVGRWFVLTTAWFAMPIPWCLRVPWLKTCFFFFGQKSSELIQEKKGKQLWKSALTKQSLFGHQGEDLFSTILNWKLFLASFKIETFREFAIQKVSVETPVKPCRSVAWGEMWFGYIGQVEVVNGGVVGRDGKLAPARTALSCLANEATHLRVLHGSTWIEVWIWLLLLAFRRCPSPHCWENCVYLGLHVKMP